MKTCTKCGESKPLTEYHKATGTKDKLQTRCKSCRKIHQTAWYTKNQEKIKQRKRDIRKEKPDAWKTPALLKQYNITFEDYTILLEQQNHCCAICKKHSDSFTVRLAVDHCHTTGKIRGLLCSRCNTALGLFLDNEQSLREAISYLQRSQ